MRHIKNISGFINILFFALLMAASAHTAGAQTPLRVCSRPSAPCASRDKVFAPYELSFRLPRRLRQNVDYKSAPFYAIILISVPEFEAGGDECDGGEYSTKIERRRAQAQRLFPARKVFASYQCPDMGAVGYISDGKNLNTVFVAVYAGETRAEARRVLAQAQSRFPGASIKKMQAVYNWIVQ